MARARTPITWQNIVAPSNAAANALLVNATDGIKQGFQDAGDSVQAYADNRSQTETDAFIATLNAADNDQQRNEMLQLADRDFLNVGRASEAITAAQNQDFNVDANTRANELFDIKQDAEARLANTFEYGIGQREVNEQRATAEETRKVQKALSDSNAAGQNLLESASKIKAATAAQTLAETSNDLKKIELDNKQTIETNKQLALVDVARYQSALPENQGAIMEDILNTARAQGRTSSVVQEQYDKSLNQTPVVIDNTVLAQVNGKTDFSIKGRAQLVNTLTTMLTEQFPLASEAGISARVTKAISDEGLDRSFKRGSETTLTKLTRETLENTKRKEIVDSENEIALNTSITNLALLGGDRTAATDIEFKNYLRRPGVTLKSAKALFQPIWNRNLTDADMDSTTYSKTAVPFTTLRLNPLTINAGNSPSFSEFKRYESSLTRAISKGNPHASSETVNSKVQEIISSTNNYSTARDASFLRKEAVNAVSKHRSKVGVKLETEISDFATSVASQGPYAAIVQKLQKDNPNAFGTDQISNQDLTDDVTATLDRVNKLYGGRVGSDETKLAELARAVFKTFNGSSVDFPWYRTKADIKTPQTGKAYTMYTAILGAKDGSLSRLDNDQLMAAIAPSLPFSLLTKEEKEVRKKDKKQSMNPKEVSDNIQATPSPSGNTPPQTLIEAANRRGIPVNESTNWSNLFNILDSDPVLNTSPRN